MSLLAIFTLFSFSNLQAECVKGNCLNGYGTYRFPSGAKYIGDFEDGKMSGKGILYFTNGNKYIGHWLNNLREGEGRYLFIEGHEYRGQFHAGQFHGKGTMKYDGGDRYEGNWKYDKPNGLGKYVFKDGERYEGNFKNGRFQGNGTMFYNDGSKYVGNWRENKKHGIGALHLKTGKIIEGEWRMGKYQEETAYDNPSAVAVQNSATEINTSRSLRNCNKEYCESGKGMFSYSDGSKYIGVFKNGKPEGKGKVAYSNGDRYEGEWKNHAPHGDGVMYFRNGRVLGAKWFYGKAQKEIPPKDDPVLASNIFTEKSNEVKIWAVVVGIGRYDHMPSLRYTDDDAYQFYAFLKSPEGGALPDDQIKVMIDEDATRYNILQNMKSILFRADENDVVLFYFSGHGLEGSFIPVDFDGYNNRLHHEEIKSIMKESKAKHKLVIGDACHSGSLSAQYGGELLSMKSPVDATLQKYYSAFMNADGGLALMMSSKGEEVSLEDGGLRSGIFSYYLIRGLKGEADRDADNIITVKEIFDFVYSKVRNYTATAQTPSLTGDYDANMPVGVVRE